MIFHEDIFFFFFAKSEKKEGNIFPIIYEQQSSGTCDED